MYVDLPIMLAQDYFNEVNLEIDYEETGDENMISTEEADAIYEILSTEVSIYMLRRGYGFCGSLVDVMVGLRRKLIMEYEVKYEKKYTEYNDFY